MPIGSTGQFLPRHSQQAKYCHPVPPRFPVNRYHTRLQSKSHSGTAKAPFHADCAVTLRVHPFFRISADPDAPLVQLPLDFKLTVGALLYEQHWRTAMRTLQTLLQAIRSHLKCPATTTAAANVYRAATLEQCSKPIQGQQERLALIGNDGGTIVAVSAEDLAWHRGEADISGLLADLPCTPDHPMFARPVLEHIPGIQCLGPCKICGTDGCVPNFFCVIPCENPFCANGRQLLEASLQQPPPPQVGRICMHECTHARCIEAVARLSAGTCVPGAVCSVPCSNPNCQIMRYRLGLPDGGRQLAEDEVPSNCFCISDDCGHQKCAERRASLPPDCHIMGQDDEGFATEAYLRELAMFAEIHPYMRPIHDDGDSTDSSRSSSSGDEEEEGDEEEDETGSVVATLGVDTATISTPASRLVETLRGMSAQWEMLTRATADVCRAVAHTEVAVVEISRCPTCNVGSGMQECVRVTRVDLQQYGLWRAAKVQAANSVEKYVGSSSATTSVGGLRIQSTHVCSMYRKAQATETEVAEAAGTLTVFATDRLIAKPVVLIIRANDVHEHPDDV